MLLLGDGRETMNLMYPESVDAVVVDPPYGMRFMGKKWDYAVPAVETFEAALRVLKDGGRMLCFAGARTAHRMTVNIEDAGFEIEDVIMWMFGQGFPKHRSRLKPAYEPIVVARKGGISDLNINECLIDVADSALGGGAAGKGRWPANVALDGEAAQMLDEQTGVLKSGAPAIKRASGGDRLGNAGFALGAESRWPRRPWWKLDPCPFCGHDAVIEPWHGGPKTKQLISCSNDGCQVLPSVTGRAVGEAVERWNTRCVGEMIQHPRVNDTPESTQLKEETFYVLRDPARDRYLYVDFPHRHGTVYMRGATFFVAHETAEKNVDRRFTDVVEVRLVPTPVS